MTWNVPSLFVTGSTLAATELNKIRDGLKALGDPWTFFTPTWGGATAPAIGNGTLTGGYLQTGKRVEWYISVTMGSTTTYGSAKWWFDPPVPLASRPWVAQGRAYDTSAATYFDTPLYYWPSLNSYVAYADPTTSGTARREVTATVPFTWATGDQFFMQGVAEAA